MVERGGELVVGDGFDVERDRFLKCGYDLR